MRNFDTNNQLGLRAFEEGSTRHSGGNTWYVDGNSGNAANTSGSGQGESWALPFSTINYAVSQCTNQGGDVIIVAKNHTEAIQDTSALSESGTVTDELCIDKSELTIIGMGSGTSRPTITLSGATDATVEIRAANVTFKNFIIASNLADVAAGITVANSVDGIVIENIEFRDGGAANLELVLSVSLTANADDVTIRGCQFYNTNAGDNNAAIFTTGATIRLKIHDNVFRGDWDNAVIDLDASASTDTFVQYNTIFQFDATVGGAILLHGSTTGAVTDNTIHCPVGSSAGPVVASGVLVARNYFTINEGESAEELALGSNSSVGPTHWYVDSGSGTTTGDGKSWATALSLVDDAIGKCTGANGDIIHVATGHAETDMDGTTGQIFDVDVAGVTIVGEGVGDARPTFTFTTDATNALVDLSADDCRLTNLRFLCNMASQENMIKVHGDNCEIDHCDFAEGGQQPLTCITIGGASDGLADDTYIHDNKFYIPTGGPAVSAIDIVRDETGIRIVDNNIRGDFDNACVEIDTVGDACVDFQLLHNILINDQAGDHALEISGVAVTGLIEGNTFVTDTRDQAAQPSLCQMVNNKWVKLGTGHVGIDNVDPVTSGIHLFVNSSATGGADTAGHGYSWAEPVATIDYAVSLCTGDAGDVIHVAPGHEETLTNSVFIDLDVAGVYVLGHGSGLSKPLITFDHADGEVRFGANDCTFDNFRLRASVDDVTNGILYEDGFTGCVVRNCDFGFPETSTDEFAAAIVTGDATDYALIENCRFMAGAQAAVVGIDLVKDTDHTIIRNNLFTGAYSVAPIRGQTTASTYLDIHHNTFLTTGTTDTFNLVAGSTGMVHHNTVVLNAASYSLAMDIGNCWNVENYAIADDDVGGAKGGLVDNGFASCVVTADG